MKTSKCFEMCETFPCLACTSMLSSRYKAGQVKLLEILVQIQEILNVSVKKKKKRVKGQISCYPDWIELAKFQTICVCGVIMCIITCLFKMNMKRCHSLAKSAGRMNLRKAAATSIFRDVIACSGSQSKVFISFLAFFFFFLSKL